MRKINSNNSYWRKIKIKADEFAFVGKGPFALVNLVPKIQQKYHFIIFKHMNYYYYQSPELAMYGKIVSYYNVCM